jgi:hypothetical protein
MAKAGIRPRSRRTLNCWEFKRCGRGLNGSRRSGRPLCPAATETEADGINRGVNGGRVCWAVAGTLCDGRQQGTDAVKLETCLACDFCQLVLREERVEPCEKYRSPKARR